jgi:hypothetical protein
MSLSRRRFLLTAGAAGLALPAVPNVFAQDPLAGIPEGPLRDQITWFIDLLNDEAGEMTEESVEAHFSPDFLLHVPASEVISIVEQMRSLLGTVTVQQVQEGATDIEASVLLIGSTGLEILLTVSVNPESGLIEGLLLQPVTSEDQAIDEAASPVASPVAYPVAAALAPPTTDEILADYEAAVESLTAAGREFTEAFIAGEDDAVTGMLSESIVAMLGDFSASESMAELTTNMVSFSIAEVSAYFVGHYTPEAIGGLFHQGTQGAFALTPAEEQSGDFPTGLWSGDIIIGAATLGIEVTFSGTADALEATISIPEQMLADHPLSDVRFEAERPLGTLVDERALPMGPSMGTTSYGAIYEWGDKLLVINSAFDEENMVIGVTPAMQIPLPEDPAAAVDGATTFQLPFDGAWMVIWGGDTEFLNYHAPVPQQRYAHDIVIWRDGATYTGDGSQLEQYHCYGQPQYAPADGTVVTVVDEYPDAVPGQLATDPMMHPGGNHIVLEVGEGEYVFMAHLIPGSVTVAEGDTVAAGDAIGLTGNSGNSSEPHIHMHMQSGPDMMDPAAIGLPMEFTNILVNGEAVDSARIEQGQIIEPA